MNIQRVEAEGVMRYGQLVVQFPKTGLIVVTGHNGAGKSSLVETVAAGYWGKTMRGTSPWASELGKSHILVWSDQANVFRKRSGGKRTIEFTTPDHPVALEYESGTKAQDALEQTIGDFERWRRTHVFSASDAAHFTMSTDAERKRLLEAILGLNRFDDALEACRSDLKAVVAMASAVQMRLDNLVSVTASQKKRLADAEQALALLPAEVDTAASEAEKAKLTKMLATSNGEIDAIRKTIRQADNGWTTLEASARENERRLAALANAKCDRCGQPIPQEKRDALQESVEKDRAKAADMKAKAKEMISASEAQLEELEDEANMLKEKVLTLDMKVTQERTNAKQRAHLKQAILAASADLEAGAHQEKQLKTQGATALINLGELTACETVLGLRGVRAHILSKTLTGLEQVANVWLQRIAGKMKLSLKPYSEKKSGGVSDSISLEIDGAGNGFGYKASSGGERRRIDVALLLALAEISHGSAGKEPGTMFFDEVFDALDPAGEEAVTAALAELATRRAVVVITHTPTLAARIPATQRLNFVEGKVSLVQ